MDYRPNGIIECSARGTLVGLTVDDNPSVQLLRPTKDDGSCRLKVRSVGLSVVTGDEAEQLSGPVIVLKVGAPD